MNTPSIRNEARFTPGPWVADRSSVKHDAGLQSHFTCGLTRTAYGTREEMLANARLIAAAPCMYDTLAGLRDALAEMDAELHAQNIAVIDLTLARARGETA